MIQQRFLITDQNNQIKYKIKKNITFITISQVAKKVKKFAGVKFFVQIQGFDYYKINVNDLCEKLKALGNSVFFSSETQVKFQGKITNRVIRIFIEIYKIPIDFIKTSKS